MASKFALPVNLRAFPLTLNAALSVEPVPLTSSKVCVDPASTSVAVNVPTIAFAALFSARLLADNAMSVGTSFTAVTDNAFVTAALFDRPSFTTHVTVRSKVFGFSEVFR